MPDLILQALSTRTALSPEQRDLLAKGTIEYTRREKREYQRSIAPRLGEFQRRLAEAYADQCRRDPSTTDTWAATMAFNIMSRGYATVADTLGMSVIGRRKVSDIIKNVRGRRAEASPAPTSRWGGRSSRA